MFELKCYLIWLWILPFILANSTQLFEIITNFDEIFRPNFLQISLENKFLKAKILKKFNGKDTKMDFVNKCEIKEGLIILNANETMKSTKINERIFYLNLPFFELWESYKIDEKTFENKLGRFQGSIYIPNPRVNQNFFKRRGNFLGKNFKVMVHQFPPRFIFNPDYKIKARFHPENQTFQMNGFVSGYFLEALQRLEKQYNFSTNLFARSDQVLDIPQIFSNGTKLVNGIIGDLSIHGDAEIGGNFFF